jgi:hypothetical protein
MNLQTFMSCATTRIPDMEWVFLAVGGVIFSFIVGGYLSGRGGH